jgi:riboflavin kinase / FMN adenylyltransferase
MKVFSDYTNIDDGDAKVVAIGNFDGVHRGHQALIEQAALRAISTDTKPSVLTFDPHPVKLFAPDVDLQELTSLQERVALMQHYGVAMVLAQTFDRAFASLSDVAFAREVLSRGMRAQAVVVGYDFRFGAGRKGDSDALRRYGADLGFDVVVIDPVTESDSVAISSTRVRAELSNGHLDEVRGLLGRSMHFFGEVVRGEQRGRRLGFRTANIQPDVDIFMPSGVYSGWLDYGEGPFKAVANIGHTPTFGADRPKSLEVHVLNREVPELYGRCVRFWLADFIRPERRFESADRLVRQIHDDCAAALRGLEMPEMPPTLAWP